MRLSILDDDNEFFFTKHFDGIDSADFYNLLSYISNNSFQELILNFADFEASENMTILWHHILTATSFKILCIDQASFVDIYPLLIQIKKNTFNIRFSNLNLFSEHDENLLFDQLISLIPLLPSIIGISFTSNLNDKTKLIELIHVLTIQSSLTTFGISLIENTFLNFSCDSKEDRMLLTMLMQFPSIQEISVSLRTLDHNFFKNLGLIVLENMYLKRISIIYSEIIFTIGDILNFYYVCKANISLEQIRFFYNNNANLQSLLAENITETDDIDLIMLEDLISSEIEESNNSDEECSVEIRNKQIKDLQHPDQQLQLNKYLTFYGHFYENSKCKPNIKELRVPSLMNLCLQKINFWVNDTSHRSLIKLSASHLPIELSSLIRMKN